MEGAVALVLALLAIPFVLPLVSWVMARRLKTRVEDLEARIAEQDERITNLTTELARVKKAGVAPSPIVAPAATAAQTRRDAALEQRPPVITPPPVPEPPAKPVTPPPVTPPRAAAPPSASARGESGELRRDPAVAAPGRVGGPARPPQPPPQP